MKILVISSQYGGAGGYGQLCEETSRLLASKGHSIQVLTCKDQNGSSCQDLTVNPVLSRDPDWDLRWPGYVQFFNGRVARERADLRAFEHTLREFGPHVIFVWQGTGLPRTLFAVAERSGCPVVYRLCDYWPSVADEYWDYWNRRAWSLAAELPKRVLAPLAFGILRREEKPLRLDFDNAICVSDAVCRHLREAGVSLRNAVTIFNGVNLDDFLMDLDGLPSPRRGEDILSLLYGGGILQHKGVHVAVEAMRYLDEDPVSARTELTIVGDGPRDYVAHLHELVSRWRLQDRVHFVDAVQRTQIPTILREHDVLLFPSLGEEALSRMMQEAMAAGVAVVGTSTGGSKEILADGLNALVCAPGDAADMAAQVRRLEDDGLRLRLVKAAQETVIARCDIRRTIVQVESYLQQVIEDCRRVAP